MNIVVNKTMNENYLENYLTTIMHPTVEYYENFLAYTDIANGKFDKVEYPFILMAPQSYLSMIEKLNSLEYAGALDLGGLDFTLVMNTLYAKDQEVRNSMIDYLVAQGIFTEDEVQGAKTLTSDFLNFNVAEMTHDYVDTTIEGNEDLKDVIEYNYVKPIELGNKYDVANNPNGEELFLVILPLINKTFGSTDGTYGDYVSTQKFKNGESTSLQSSYIAIALGDINDEDADIKYDHLDKIDYIDSFKFRFRLPKIFS